MKESLLRGLDSDRADTIKESFIRGKHFREFMVEKLQKDLDQELSFMLNKDLSNQPNWEMDQRERVATMRLIKKFISYLE